MVKLRWQYGVDGAWRALGTDGRTYVVEPNAKASALPCACRKGDCRCRQRSSR